jgi:hypothetical protein
MRCSGLRPTRRCLIYLTCLTRLTLTRPHRARGERGRQASWDKVFDPPAFVGSGPGTDYEGVDLAYLPTKLIICPECSGTGLVDSLSFTLPWDAPIMIPCPHCTFPKKP